MKIFCVGFHMEGVEAFDFLAKNYNVVGLMTLNTDAASKRSGVFNFQSFSEEANIPYYEVKHINDESSVDIIKNHAPDILIVLGWSQLLNEEVLSIPTIGTIGAHASLLPKMRGSAPINWAIIKGEEKTGNTLMWLNIGVDTGKIIDQYEFEINIYDSCNTLYENVAKSNKIMLERSLPLIEKNGQIGTVQEEGDEDILPRRRPKDGLIDFNKNTIEVYNFVRALTRPYPGAFFQYNDQKVIIWKASYSKQYKASAESGVVVDYIYSFDDTDCAVLISTKDGAIIINEIETETKIIKGKDLHNFFKLNDKI
ncbi:methionyl-tRNA formyltransferase [Kordia jejudonensis]|uniref:methionyl-tRNA formyltransferase n=1 Tax=Kordia jejudonensis TaxID=1348245 RepID=UPI00069C9469|nr:methionyl-tRNA formyltransferase [Kordia jejudonensis]